MMSNYPVSRNGESGPDEASGGGNSAGNGGRRARKPRYIWLDGELVSFDRATVHFLSPTLHYGPGVIEGIRCYVTERGPAVFRLREHLERFIKSIHILGIADIHHDVESLRAAVAATIQANGYSECYVRPLMYMDGPLTLNLDDSRPVIGIAAWPWRRYFGPESRQKGIRVMTSSYTRMHPNAGMTKAKFSGQYITPMMAKTMASRSGFDEAIMLDPDGYVADCSGGNLFVVRDGVISTPAGWNIWEGVTRDTVMTLAADAGYTFREARITRDQLYIADEAFVAGTAIEIAPVREVDHRAIGDGRAGPITQALQARYFEAVHGRDDHAVKWLDFLVTEPLL